MQTANFKKITFVVIVYS